jgi:hypothetical protein
MYFFCLPGDLQYVFFGRDKIAFLLKITDYIYNCLKKKTT